MGCCWSCGCYLKDEHVKGLLVFVFVISTFVVGQVCIITGGNQGIGYSTAKGLIQKGMHVIIGTTVHF